MSPRPILAALAAPAAAVLLCGAAAGDGAPEVRQYRDGAFLVREITGRAAPAPRLVLATDFGSVSAAATTDGRVVYKVRLRVAADVPDAAARLDALQVGAARVGDSLIVSGRIQGADSGGIDAAFDLGVPDEARDVEIATGAGDVRARGIAGRLALTTRGGGIAADAIGGPLLAETRGGDIDVGSVVREARLATAGGRVRLAQAGGDVVAQTTGGDLQIGRAARAVRAESGGGNVRVDSAGADVVVQTGGGNIALGAITGQVTAATAGGSIRVASAGGGVRAETAAGPITLEGIAGPVRAVTSAGSIRAVFVPAGRMLFDSDIQTWQGDVTVTLPETLPVDILAVVDNSIGRRIRSDFPLVIAREAEDAGRPVETAQGRVAGGGAALRLRTLGGMIVIVKAVNDRPR